MTPLLIFSHDDVPCSLSFLFLIRATERKIIVNSRTVGIYLDKEMIPEIGDDDTGG